MKTQLHHPVLKAVRNKLPVQQGLQLRCTMPALVSNCAILFLLLSLLFASCEKDNSNSGSVDIKKEPVNFFEVNGDTSYINKTYNSFYHSPANSIAKPK
jgi:hypothetical protein